MSTNNNQPVEKLHDGLIEIAIWKNQTDKGHFYSTSVTNSYQDDSGAFKTTERFSPEELLKLNRLTDLAYDRIRELRQADKAASRAA